MTKYFNFSLTTHFLLYKQPVYPQLAFRTKNVKHLLELDHLPRKKKSIGGGVCLCVCVCDGGEGGNFCKFESKKSAIVLQLYSV